MPAAKDADDPGSIVREEAYARGKMLENHSWAKVLRKGVTPSDLDLPGIPWVMDNRGPIIYGDFDIKHDNWNDHGKARKGQRWTYENAIQLRPHCAVICKHSVTGYGRKIDTMLDVERFQAMVWDFGYVLSPVYVGQRTWQRFVMDWVNKPDGPVKARRRIIGLYG